jgi:hypothetical protein
VPDTETIDATDLPPLKTGTGGLGLGQPVAEPAPGTDTDSPISAIQRQSSGLTGPSGSLTYNALRRSAASDAADAKLNERLDRDRAERERAYRAEAAGPDTLPPKWDADAERAKRSHGPIESFGSVGVIFALAASAFTKKPMISALNGAAEAMNAIKAGDEERYKSAYAAWKDNTELAIKRFDMEHKLVEDADKLATTDMAEWRTKRAEIAARFDDQKSLAMLEAGLDPDVIKTTEAAVNAKEKMLKAKDEIETFDLRHDLLKIEGETFQQAHPDASQYDVLLHKLQTKDDMMTGKKSIEESVLSDARQQYWQQHGKPMPYEEQAKVVQSMKTAGGAANFALQRFLQENPNATAAQIQSFIGQSHMARSAPAMALQKFMQEHPDASSEDIKQFAAEYSQEQKAIRDFATSKQGQAVNSLSVAVDHLDTLRNLSAALKNGNFPAFNQIAQRWAQENGKQAPTNFDAARQIIGQEIVKAVVGGGGGVTERNQAQEILSRVRTPEQMEGAIETIEKLMAGQLRGLKRQYEVLTNRKDFDKRLSPRALDVLDSLPAEGGSHTSTPGGGVSGVTPSGISYTVQP